MEPRKITKILRISVLQSRFEWNTSRIQIQSLICTPACSVWKCKWQHSSYWCSQCTNANSINIFLLFPYKDIRVLQSLINCIIFREVVFVIPADVTHFKCSASNSQLSNESLGFILSPVGNSWWRSVCLRLTHKWFTVKGKEGVLIWNIKLY